MDPVTVVVALAVWLVSLIALYVVIRLAVVHALRAYNRPAPVRSAPGLLPPTTTTARAAHLDQDGL
jgi:hypothetical protein